MSLVLWPLFKSLALVKPVLIQQQRQQQKKVFTFVLILQKYLNHCSINRFFNHVFWCLHCCGWSDTRRSGLAGIHCLSFCSTKQTIQLQYGNIQTDGKTNRESDCVLPCPCSAFCMQSAEAGCLSRSLVECLCNWMLRWSSSNHGRIIKTCWSLQSWERGRFINDTLTTALGLCV